jgi:hypothetical protein
MLAILNLGRPLGNGKARVAMGISHNLKNLALSYMALEAKLVV